MTAITMLPLPCRKCRRLFIHDPDNIREYYQRLFDGSTDKKALTEGIDARSFEQTAAQYKLIDNTGVQIIVPYAEKRELHKSISKQHLLP